MDILFPEPNLVSRQSHNSREEPAQFTYETPIVVSTGIAQSVRTLIPKDQRSSSIGVRGIPIDGLSSKIMERRRTGEDFPSSFVGSESEIDTDEETENTPHELFIKQITETYPVISMEQYNKAKTAIDEMSGKNVLNLKELRLLTRTSPEDLPKDIFNIICDNIIHEITNSHTLVFTTFRENLYDILIYNLDITECVWYILTHFIRIGVITDTTEILSNIYTFLKYYNNNYRPIYHLESILFYLLLEVRKQQDVNVQPNTNDKKTGISSVGNTPVSRPTATGKYKSRKNTGTV
jgi:hypothetical protein